MPHQEKPKYVWDCDWDNIDKIHSRYVTIINLYRDVFGVSSIPPDKQYWTMCGAHFNSNGYIEGELGHLVKEKFIQESQFNGVDREEVIININSGGNPDANWHYGDFLETMESHENFNPAVINYDGVMQPKFGTRYLKSIFKFIDYNVEGELLMTANFLLNNPYTFNKKLMFSIDDTIKELSSKYWFPDHWTVVPQAYSYGSSQGFHSRMGMLMFIKKEHNIDELSITRNRRICKNRET